MMGGARWDLPPDRSTLVSHLERIFLIIFYVTNYSWNVTQDHMVRRP